jgi:AcrR family transcriptional regulator
MIRAMTASQTTRPGAWSTHRADIETRIVEAYMELLETGTPTGVSMPAVAERAGVSVRTLYRYFPNKDDLQRVAAGWFERRTRNAMDDATVDISNVRQYLRLLWTDLADRLPAVRVQHTTPDGRTLRAARLPDSRAAVDRALSDDVTGERRREMIDLVIAVTSSSMFLELVDRMGHEPTRAAELAADLIELIVGDEATPGGRHTRGRLKGP